MALEWKSNCFSNIFKNAPWYMMNGGLDNSSSFTSPRDLCLVVISYGLFVQDNLKITRSITIAMPLRSTALEFDTKTFRWTLTIKNISNHVYILGTKRMSVLEYSTQQHDKTNKKKKKIEYRRSVIHNKDYKIWLFSFSLFPVTCWTPTIYCTSKI